MDTQLYISIDLLPIMAEIQDYAERWFRRDIKNYEAYELAKEYVGAWQDDPDMGVTEWVSLSRERVEGFGKL